MLGFSPISDQPISSVPGAAGGAYTIACDPAAFTLAAQDATLIRGRVVVADAAAFTLAAQDATLIRGRVVTADPAAFTVAAQDATLTYATPGAYTIACDAAAFTLAAQDATLTFTPIASTGGGVPWNVWGKTGETEDQKRTRRLAQGIIARAKKPTADIGRLKEQAARVSGLLREDAERLDALAERYQVELRQKADDALRDTLMRARNDALATRQLEARMIQAQVQAESARQQIEELDIVFLVVMLAAL